MARVTANANHPRPWSKQRAILSGHFLDQTEGKEAIELSEKLPQARGQEQVLTGLRGTARENCGTRFPGDGGEVDHSTPGVLGSVLGSPL